MPRKFKPSNNYQLSMRLTKEINVYGLFDTQYFSTLMRAALKWLFFTTYLTLKDITFHKGLKPEKSAI